MPTLNIKNQHVYELAKRLSEVTGRSMTSVIEQALERQLAEWEQPRFGVAARLMDLAHRTAPLLTELPADPFAALYDEVTGGTPVILDSSAIVAVLRLETEAEMFAELIQRATVVRISGATVLESTLVLGTARDRDLDEFLGTAGAFIEPVSLAQVVIARQAFRRFGRGSGHPARLNFGDCFSYAVSMDFGEPLLFKGDDFGCTDVIVARP